MSQGSLSPKIRFLGQKMCFVAWLRTDTQTDMKVTTEGTLSGFQDFFKKEGVIKANNALRRHIAGSRQDKTIRQAKPLTLTNFGQEFRIV